MSQSSLKLFNAATEIATILVADNLKKTLRTKIDTLINHIKADEPNFKYDVNHYLIEWSRICEKLKGNKIFVPDDENHDRIDFKVCEEAPVAKPKIEIQSVVEAKPSTRSSRSSKNKDGAICIATCKNGKKCEKHAGENSEYCGLHDPVKIDVRKAKAKNK